MKYRKPMVIAEIGCNHKGDIEIAKKLIKEAKNCGADVAKFQKRNNKELLSEEQYSSPHPNRHNSYGDTYGEHREFLEFTIEQHAELKQYAESEGVVYSTSVWDVTSAKEVIALNPKLIKIPSAGNSNLELLKLLRDTYKGEIHISFGMTPKQEQQEIVRFFEEANIAKDQLVIYACTSGYPIQPEEACLLEITRLTDAYGDKVKSIGYSGHHNGIALDIAAYTLGAEWIERHFTLDRTWKGTDHAASLEPGGLQKLVRDLRESYAALTYKTEDLLPVEKVQYDKLKFRADKQDA